MASDVPKEIIQHIQSFLNRREAARSMILSKPWFNAWSTRPVLYFNDDDFLGNEFWNFSRKTIQRYKELNLRIEKFILRKEVFSTSLPLDELIVDALRLGGNALELEIDITPRFSRSYVLPAQVFATSSLTRLNLNWLAIHLPKGGVLCSRLKSLSLIRCRFTGDIVREILLGCPLIEELYLRDCCFVKFHINTELCFLRRLLLYRVEVSDDFFMMFSSSFPCIEDLTLEYFDASENIQISSHSLRYLNFTNLRGKLKTLQCNVPNISRFVLKEVSSIPLLSFNTASKEWESEVEFTKSENVINDATWFVELRDFLTELRQSRISLGIKFNGTCLSLGEGLIPCFHIILLEKLSIFSHPSSDIVHELLIALFRICRPNFITKFKSIGCSQDYRVQRLVFELLVQKKERLCKYNLEEVSIEFFEKNIMEWLPFAEHTDALPFSQDNTQIRFRLNWARGNLISVV